MKLKYLAFITLAALPLTAVADQEASSEPKAYFGFKTGGFDIGVGGAETVTASGFFGGVYFTESSSVEVEFLNSEESKIYNGYSFATMKIKTTAFYYAYKSSEPLYFKYRFGFLNEKVTGGDGLSGSISDSGLSLGLGAGYDFGSVLLEVGYTLIEADINYFSIGLAAQL